MKFLCPSCKAKYQIADEKVAGRSVRMKCRKCGHVIQVSSVAGVGDALLGSEPPSAIDAASDASAAQAAAPPAAVEAAPAEPAPVELPAVAPAPAAAKPGPKPQPKVEPKKPPASPTRPSAARPAPAPAPVAAKGPLPAPKPPPPAKSAPMRPAAPVPSTLGLKSEKKTIQGGTSASLPRVGPIGVKPAAPGGAKPAAAAASILADFGDEDESTRIADSSALAGAFSLAVGGASDAPPPDALSMPADEWFVGINGVPVGPIRLSELRSKAASGSVTRESLVWRDGFEDWRPLKTYPELVAIVDESVSSARASLTPFTPSVATAAAIAGAGVGAVSDPFATPGAAGQKTPDPFALGATAGVTGTAVVTDDLEAAGIGKRSGSSPAAWIAVAIALLFGLTIGFVVFKQQSKTIEVVKYVDRVVPGPSAAANGDNAQSIGDTTVSPDTKSIGKHSVAGVKSGASSEATGGTGLKGLNGLSGLSGLGPSHGPDTSGPSGNTSGGGQLDSGQIQNTVSRYTGSVKRACWQPALDTRDKDAPTTAKVTVSITVQPSGSVSNASVGGDPRGYRGLAQCISSRVRGWQFPPSGDTTTVNVPFVFAAQ
jgi:TonB family protein